MMSSASQEEKRATAVGLQSDSSSLGKCVCEGGALQKRGTHTHTQ